MVHARVNREAKWFAVYTNSRHEKWVAKHFEQRQIENFLPLYQKVHRWAKRSAISLDLPLFPNYVFVHIAPEQRVSVLEAPGVLTIVGSGHFPSAMPESEIESIRSGLQERKIAPHPMLVIGERVRMKAGAMEGMEGVLLRQKNDLRVILTLELIQRSVAVEVDASDIEPAVMHRCMA